MDFARSFLQPAGAEMVKSSALTLSKKTSDLWPTRQHLVARAELSGLPDEIGGVRNWDTVHLGSVTLQIHDRRL